jgi:hypothetical protein
MLCTALFACAGLKFNTFETQRKGVNGVLKLESRNPLLPPFLRVSKILVF